MESRVREVFGDSGIEMVYRVNVGMKDFKVHDCGGLEYQRIEYGCSEGGCKLVTLRVTPEFQPTRPHNPSSF